MYSTIDDFPLHHPSPSTLLLPACSGGMEAGVSKYPRAPNLSQENLHFERLVVTARPVPPPTGKFHNILTRKSSFSKIVFDSPAAAIETLFFPSAQKVARWRVRTPYKEPKNSIKGYFECWDTGIIFPKTHLQSLCTPSLTDSTLSFRSYWRLAILSSWNVPLLFPLTLSWLERLVKEEVSRFKQRNLTGIHHSTGFWPRIWHLSLKTFLFHDRKHSW